MDRLSDRAVRVKSSVARGTANGGRPSSRDPLVPSFPALYNILTADQYIEQQSSTTLLGTSAFSAEEVRGRG